MSVGHYIYLVVCNKCQRGLVMEWGIIPPDPGDKATTCFFCGHCNPGFDVFILSPELDRQIAPE